MLFSRQEEGTLNGTKAPLARLIQNGFTGEAKAGEARKTDFFRLLVHFNPG